MKRAFFIYLIICINYGLFSQGIFAPPAGQPGSTAIHKDSTIIVGWASGCTVTRGLKQIDSASLGYASSGVENNAIGQADGQTISLGDSGRALIIFTNPIYNGLGADFVVFENGFDSSFLELAFVEVSSDGINFFRFYNQYTDQDTLQIGTFGSVNTTHVNNLAGKYKVMYGTPFDLDDVVDNPLLNKNAITHLKLIDVIGSINHPTFDSEGRKMNDPFPTAFPQGGFDLDAVGVINQNITTSISENIKFDLIIYPNPVETNLTIKNKSVTKLAIVDLNGKILKEAHSSTLNVNELNPGIYFVFIELKNNTITKRFVKK